MKNKRNGLQLYRRLRPLVAVLAFAVAIAVFWRLKLVGIAMAGEAFCGQAEHTHTADCIAQQLVCTEAHEHTDECAREIYTCGMEAHTHVAACYANATADVETASVWEATLPEQTGAVRTDVAAIARSQLGYTESEQNFELNDDGTRRGYTRYGAWYGHSHGDWSAMFVSFCLHYAGLPTDAAPYATGTNTMWLAWKQAGLVASAADAEPQPGDVIFLDSTGSGKCTDVGIVDEIADAVTVIRGDCDDRVATRTYARNDPTILGYGRIDTAALHALPDAERAQVEKVRAEVAALPTVQALQARLADRDSDSAANANRYRALFLQIQTAYAYYEDLAPKDQALVAGEKLETLHGMVTNELVGSSGTDSVRIFQTDTYQYAQTTAVHGGSPRDVLKTGMTFAHWGAVVVEHGDTGDYVSQVLTDDRPKNDLKPSTADGYVLLVYGADRAALENIAFGDAVTDSAEFFRTQAANTGAVANAALPEIVPSADTGDLIEVNLYDYGNNINDLFRQDSKYPGFQNPGGTTGIWSQIGSYSMNFGDNVTSDYDAGMQEITKNHGGINGTNPVDSANRPIEGAISDHLIDGYPALADGTSLAYLFRDSTYATKKNNRSVNGLFRYDAQTGAYHYNSHDNHAQFSAADDTFTLYKQTITSNFIMYPFGNFLPFNDITTEATPVMSIKENYFVDVAKEARQKYNSNGKNEYKVLADVLNKFVSIMNTEAGSGWNYRTLLNKYFHLSAGIPEFSDEMAKPLENMYNIDYDNPTDFFFGMSMRMEFMQPKNGLTGLDGQQPMVYEFAGDDDVWIFIDGKLFLDLSGIHRHVGGKIDFVEGKVYYYALDPQKGDVPDTPYRTVTFAEILGSRDGLNEKGAFSDYSEHTLNFYYMERGSGSSVCRMNFNLPLLQKNRISVTKQLDKNLDEALGNPAFRFQVLKENGQELLIGAGTTYQICDATGRAIGTGQTDEHGVFTVHAGETAVFANIPENSGRYFVRELIEDSVVAQYGKVTVSGSSETVNGQNVTVGTDTFQSFDSPVKDMADGSTAFRFTNEVDITKYGKLTVEKQVNDYSAIPSARAFTFTLTIDDRPVPVGTAYTLVQADGAQTGSAISEAGKVTLHPGERAVFSQILAGSCVRLTEDPDSAAGYTVTYIGTGIRLTDADGGVTGVIRADGTSQITVRNERDGTKLTIPVQKTLLYPDGTARTYRFALREVHAADDPTPVENGQYLLANVTLADGTQDFAFVLNYPPETTVPGTYYYQIWEEDGAAVGADSSRYMVTVRVAETDGAITAEIAGITKNDAESVDAVSFVNRNVRSLTIEKTVRRVQNCTTKFRFDLTASVADAPLSGAYDCAGKNGSGTVIFTDGHATIELGDGESVTISGLPYGTVWCVSEQTAESFFTECGRGDATAPGNTVDGTLSADDAVRFVNIGGYELPATGSCGALVCTVVGGAMMLAALIGGCVLRRKRKNKER